MESAMTGVIDIIVVSLYEKEHCGELSNQILRNSKAEGQKHARPRPTSNNIFTTKS